MIVVAALLAGNIALVWWQDRRTAHLVPTFVVPEEKLQELELNEQNAAHRSGDLEAKV